jgi:hypothetical protein
MGCALRFILAASFFLTVVACGPESRPDPRHEPDPKAETASSRDVEITAIRILRQKSVDVLDEAELAKIEIALWFKANGEDVGARHLVSVLELDPVVDETGKLLSTKQRLDGLPFLRDEVLNDHGRIADAKHGPLLGLVLDAPDAAGRTHQNHQGQGGRLSGEVCEP